MSVVDLLKKSAVFVAVNAAAATVQTYVGDKLKDYMEKKKETNKRLSSR